MLNLSKIFGVSLFAIIVILLQPAIASACACCVGSHRVIHRMDSINPFIWTFLKDLKLDGILDTSDHEEGAGGFLFDIKVTAQFKDKAFKLKFITSDGMEGEGIFSLGTEWRHYKLRGTVAFPKEFPKHYSSEQYSLYHEYQFPGTLELKPDFLKKLGASKVTNAELVIFGNSNECFGETQARGWSLQAGLKNSKLSERIHGRGTIQQ